MAPAPSEQDAYDKIKARARSRNLSLSLSGRDIGELPDVVNPDRRDACERDFELFCRTYYPPSFYHPFSDDHRQVAKLIETVTLQGGLFAMAMPRGFGKTTLCETGGQWAVLYGHHLFAAIIGAESTSAQESLDSIKRELETNDLLMEDFPEVCHAIRALDGIAQRVNGQLYGGHRTWMGWEENVIILPTIYPSAAWKTKHPRYIRADGQTMASGAIVKVAGLTGRIRGMKHKRVDGKNARPSLVILDDPQTDESADSAAQNEKRLRILNGAVLYMNGPGQSMTGYMPCTVIRRDDMADTILDRKKNPEWHGIRTKMVYAWPIETKLWDEYARLRRLDLDSDGDTDLATEYYAANRERMDAGAKLAWPQDYPPDCLSALQFATNLRIRNEASFFAERQNEPLDDLLAQDMLTPGEIAAKTNGMARGRAPMSATHLTAFIDVQQKMLFYVVAAWEDNFTGYVVDYGAFPDQHSGYFTMREARRTLAHVTPRAGLEGAIYGGLEKLTEQVLGNEWRRDDGTVLRIERCLIDANWGQSTDVVYQFCRQSPHAALLMPSHGRYVGASSVPMHEYKAKPGERAGLNWRLTAGQGKRAVRHVIYDTNFWKSFVHARLAVPMGDPGCLSLWGRKAETHKLFAEHLTSEYRVRTEARGRTVDEWKAKPNQPDNHWLDGIVGAAVAAAMLGAALPGMVVAGARIIRRGKWSDRQRNKRRA